MTRVSVFGGGGLTFVTKTGADLTGNDGDTDRTLTQTHTQIFVDGIHLHPTVDFSSAGDVITFLNPIFDDQNITIWN